MENNIYPTWEELLNMKEGTRLKEWDEGEIRCVIMRSSASLCAYLGVATTHRLAGEHYDNMEINCHGGLTYAGEGDGGYLPIGYYFYGWDYAHAYDYPFYNDLYPIKDMYEKDPEMKAYRERQKREDRRWLVQDVLKDMQESIADFKRLKYRSERWYLRAIDTTKFFFRVKVGWFRTKYYRLKYAWKNK